LSKKYWLTALIILAALAIFFYVSYNSFIKKDEMVTNKFGNLQNDYQRRSDLLPNLVGAIKASTDYEKSTLTQLAEARAKVSQINVTGSPTYDSYVQQEKAQGEIATSANRVIAVIEKYPDLKSATAFIRLQDQLEGTERRIKFSRNDFNDAVMNYNKSVRSFPASLAAKLFGFAVKEGFKADAGAEKAPEINFTK
jgi:LemA protein